MPAKKGQSPMGQDYDDAVFIPRTTFQAKIQGGLGKFIHGHHLRRRHHRRRHRARRAQITALLRDRHHIGAGADDDF